MPDPVVDRITFLNAGVYEITFTIELFNTAFPSIAFTQFVVERNFVPLTLESTVVVQTDDATSVAGRTFQVSLLAGDQVILRISGSNLLHQYFLPVLAVTRIG